MTTVTRRTDAIWVLAVAGAVAAGCSSAGAGSFAALRSEEQAGLRALHAELRGPSATSEIFADDKGHAVAIAVMRQLSAPAVPEVDIYRWERRGWKQAARVTLDIGGSVAADGSGTTTPIRSVHVTPGTTPDLLVTVHYNAGPAAAILSSYGGRWHALTFHGGLTQDGDERFDVTVAKDGTVTSRENDCVPDCAAGHDIATTYRFSAATGRLEAYTNR